MASSSSASLAPSFLLLGKSEKEFINEGCRQDCRLDGRTRTQFSSFTIVSASTTTSSQTLFLSSQQRETLHFSNGSARLVGTSTEPITNSQVHLLCSVKADLVRPPIVQSSLIQLHVESLLPTRKKSWEQQLQVALEQLLLPTLNAQMKDALMLVPNEYCWRLSIDVVAVSDLAGKGRFLDCASHVIVAALQSTRLPLLQVVESKNSDNSDHNNNKETHELLVDSDIRHAKSPLTETTEPIVIVTVTAIPSGANNSVLFVLDATAAEESCAVAMVHVAVLCTKDPSVCGIRLHGTLPTSCLPECIALAVDAVQQGQVDRAYRRGTQPESFLPPTFALH